MHTQNKVKVCLGEIEADHHTGPTTLDRENLIKGLEDYLRYEKRYSEGNIHNVLIIARKLVREYNIYRPCLEDAHAVEESLRACGRIHEGTIRHYLRALELIAEYQGEKLKLKKPKRIYDREIHYLSIPEARALLQSADTVRDKSLIALMLYTGCRLGEALRLDVSDLDGNTVYFRGKTKNRHERKAILTKDAADIVRSWVKIRPVIEGNNAMYLTNDARRLGKRRAEEVVEKAGKRAGIGHRVTPHTLRHTFACQALKVMPLNLVSLQLGHRSISTTVSIYLHGNYDELRESISKFSY